MDASIATEPHVNGQAATRNVGRIEEIQGVVIEAVFSDRLPEINHAVTIARQLGLTQETVSLIENVLHSFKARCKRFKISPSAHCLYGSKPR